MALLKSVNKQQLNKILDIMYSMGFLFRFCLIFFWTFPYNKWILKMSRGCKLKIVEIGQARLKKNETQIGLPKSSKITGFGKRMRVRIL